jgi:hypothetical protein
VIRVDAVTDPKNKAKRQLEQIETARELLRPSEVRLHHVPNWLRRRLLEKIGTEFRLTDGGSVIRYAMDRLKIRFDHWGSTKFCGTTAFVSEPYASADDITDAVRFAEAVDLELRILPNSWWYPGQTLRLLFMLPKAERDAATERPLSDRNAVGSMQ